MVNDREAPPPQKNRWESARMSGVGRKLGGGSMPTQSEQEYRRELQLEREREDEERVLKSKAEAAAEKARLEKLRHELAAQKSVDLMAKRAAMKLDEEKEAAERAERVQALLEAEKLIARQQSELKVQKLAELSGRQGSGEKSSIGGGVKATALLHDLKDANEAQKGIARRRSIAELKGFQAKIVNAQEGLDFDAEKRKVELDLSIGRLKLERGPLGALYFTNPQTGMTVIDLDPAKFGYTELPEENDFQDNHTVAVPLTSDETLADFHKRKQQRQERRAIAKDVENRAQAFLESLADFNIKVPEIRPPRRPNNGRRGSGPSRSGSLAEDDMPQALQEGQSKANPLFNA